MNKFELMQAIFNMTPLEQENYFSELDEYQRSYVKDLLKQKARPEPTCELFDEKAKFSDWITSHFYVPELNGPIWLAPYQIEALDVATSKDKMGLFNYSLIAWMDIKKSIKSCIAAAVALRMAFMREWASIKVVANKREQAQSRSYFYITRALKLNPEMQKMVELGDIKINNYNIEFNFNNSNIKALPLNPKGEAGGNDDLIIWTEAWAATTKAAETMFTEMVIPPNKFGKGFKWLESYAGFTGDSPILEPIYKNNVKDEYQHKGSDIMYANGRTFALYNCVPRLPWQTKEYYIQQRNELRSGEFSRVHENKWQSSTEIFADSVSVDRCKVNLPPLKNREKIIIAVDAAYGSDGDCFAIVGISKALDEHKKFAQRISRTWRAPKGQKLSFRDANDLNNVEYPYGYLLNLIKNYNVVAVVVDPYQLHDLASEFEQKRYCWVIEMNQKSPREKADNDLFRLITDNEISINDDIVIEHIKNADSNQKGRLVKREEEKKIDLAVALSMACYIATEEGLRL